MNLNQKIDQLENEISELKRTINNLITEINTLKTTSDSNSGGGVFQDTSTKGAGDISSGLGAVYGSKVIWNDIEALMPPYGSYISSSPTRGYNNHGHSRFSGGALDIHTLELVEYGRDDEEDENSMDIWLKGGGTGNKHCQSYWDTPGIILKADKDQNSTSNSEQVDKIGKVSWVFDGQSSKWGAAAFEIDVEKCYLVKRLANGTIETDENETEMKSPLYNKDSTKTSVVWDKNARCWRFYAAYAEEPEEE